MTADTRNLVDRFKNLPVEEIINRLDTEGSQLQVAIENLERDFNMGTIVRSANAFGVRHIHVIGRRQWNKRGAMMTDKYLHVHYHASLDDFYQQMIDRNYIVYAIDNNLEATPINHIELAEKTCLLFGSEANGLTAEAVEKAQKTLEIKQFGSTRSLNVGVAAGIAMYEWSRQHRC